jgi:hypothetical protein
MSNASGATSWSSSSSIPRSSPACRCSNVSTRSYPNGGRRRAPRSSATSGPSPQEINENPTTGTSRLDHRQDRHRGLLRAVPARQGRHQHLGSELDGQRAHHGQDHPTHGRATRSCSTSTPVCKKALDRLPLFDIFADRHSVDPVSGKCPKPSTARPSCSTSTTVRCSPCRATRPTTSTPSSTDSPNAEFKQLIRRGRLQQLRHPGSLHPGQHVQVDHRHRGVADRDLSRLQVHRRHRDLHGARLLLRAKHGCVFHDDDNEAAGEVDLPMALTKSRRTTTSTTWAISSGTRQAATARRRSRTSRRVRTRPDPTNIDLPDEVTRAASTHPRCARTPRRVAGPFPTSAGTPGTTSRWPSAKARRPSRRSRWPTPTPPSPTAARATRPRSRPRSSTRTARSSIATRRACSATSACRRACATRFSRAHRGGRRPEGTAYAVQGNIKVLAGEPSHRRQDRHGDERGRVRAQLVVRRASDRPRTRSTWCCASSTRAVTAPTRPPGGRRDLQLSRGPPDRARETDAQMTAPTAKKTTSSTTTTTTTFALKAKLTRVASNIWVLGADVQNVRCAIRTQQESSATHSVLKALRTFRGTRICSDFYLVFGSLPSSSRPNTSRRFSHPISTSRALRPTRPQHLRRAPHASYPQELKEYPS